MSQPSPRSSLPLVPMIIAGVVIVVGGALLVVTLLLVLSRSGTGASAGQPKTAAPIATARPVVIYTLTPLPTSTPTDPPTPTPTVTLTPTVPPTKIFVPATRVPPTAVPPTEAPTAIPPTPVPIGRGLIKDITFDVPNTEPNQGAHIAFSFYFNNAQLHDLDLGCVGVKVFDLAGNFIKDQWSLGNSNLVHIAINSGLGWSDSVKDLPVGSYRFYLWVRYDPALCGAAGGDWENLTPGGIQVNVH